MDAQVVVLIFDLQRDRHKSNRDHILSAAETGSSAGPWSVGPVTPPAQGIVGTKACRKAT